MDVSTGASTNKSRVGSEFALRNSSLASADARGFALGPSGGLLETFDAVLRSASDSLRPAESDASSHEDRSTGEVTAEQDRPESGESGNRDTKTTESNGDGSVSKPNVDDSAEKTVAQLIDEQSSYGSTVSTDTSWKEDGTEFDSEGEVTGAAEVQPEADQWETQFEQSLSGAIHHTAAQQVDLQQAQSVTLDVQEVTPDEAQQLAKAVAGRLANDQNERGIVAETQNSMVGKWSTREPLDEVPAAGEAEEEVELKLAAGDSENQSGQRNRRVGARYSDKKDEADAYPSNYAQSFQAENAIGGSETRGLPDALLQELQNLEPVDSRSASLPLDASSIAQQHSTFVDKIIPTQSAAASVFSQNFSGSQNAVEPSGETSTSDLKASGTESQKSRDDGAAAVRTEGRKVGGGSNETQVRLVQRVARAFQRLGPDGGRVNIMLHPAELGSLKLELQIDCPTMNARLIAESEMAAGILRESLPDLRQRLSDSGIVVQNIDLQVADQPTGNSGGNSFMFEERDQSQQRRSPHSREGQRFEGERPSGEVANNDGALSGLKARSVKGSLDLRL